MNNLWKRFHERYPNANFSKFKTEKFFGKQNIMFFGRDEEIAVFYEINLAVLTISAAGLAWFLFR